MKTEVVKVTPAMARQWLKRNSNNRPIRPSHVENLRLAFERGEYVLTHQGVAFSDDGVLIDGQHRLTAISLLPDGMSFPMLVTRELDRECVFPVVDTAQCIRTTSDVLNVSREVGETGNFFAKLYAGRNAGITPKYASPFVEFAEPHIMNLIGFCGRKCKTWSSAPVRAAAVVSMISGDEDYTKLVYRSLVSSEFGSMPPSVQALYRSHMSGKVRAAQAYDLFARCLKAFSPKSANLSKIQINDQARVIASVREFLDEEIHAKSKKRPSSAVLKAKGVSGPNYRIEGL
jgi:hypothetical protein